MRLVAGLRPDPLVELTVLPQTPCWIKGEGKERGKREREEMKKSEEWEDPPMYKHVDSHGGLGLVVTASDS